MDLDYNKTALINELVEWRIVTTTEALKREKCSDLKLRRAYLRGQLQTLQEIHDLICHVYPELFEVNND